MFTLVTIPTNSTHHSWCKCQHYTKAQDYLPYSVHLSQDPVISRHYFVPYVFFAAKLSILSAHSVSLRLCVKTSPPLPGYHSTPSPLLFLSHPCNTLFLITFAGLPATFSSSPHRVFVGELVEGIELSKHFVYLVYFVVHTFCDPALNHPCTSSVSEPTWRLNFGRVSGITTSFTSPAAGRSS